MTPISFFFTALLISGIFFPVTGKESPWSTIRFPVAIPTCDTLFSIYGFDGHNAIAVGSGGIVMRCSDGDSSINVMHYGNRTFRWVDFINQDIGWTVGDSGSVIHTTDGGSNWENQHVPVSVGLNAVSSADANNAWAVGDNGVILHTSDGGGRWVCQAQGVGTLSDTADTFDLISVSFKNSFIGCAGGNMRKSRTPVVFMTCDGGNHWTPADMKVPWDRASELYEVLFVNDQLQIFVNFGTCYFSSSVTATDCFSDITIRNLHFSMESFATRYIQYVSYHRVRSFNAVSNLSLFAIDSVNSMTAWMAGEYGAVYRTTDQGKNWILLNSDALHPVDDLSAVGFADPSNGFIGGKNGTILVSDNGGADWKFTAPPVNPMMHCPDIGFHAPQHGYILLESKSDYHSSVLVTSDGGGNWNALPVADRLGLFRFINDHSYAASDGYSHIYLSGDAGTTWSSGAFNDIQVNDIYSMSTDTVWLAGTFDSYREISEGCILKSTDRGQSLDLNSSVDHAFSRGKIFRSIFFSTPSTGWVTGDSGLMLTSRDSGFTWQRLPRLTTCPLSEIRFLNAAFGWTYGDSTVLMTTDSGAHWAAIPPPPGTSINDFTCPDPANCWAVGNSGLILHLAILPTVTGYTGEPGSHASAAPHKMTFAPEIRGSQLRFNPVEPAEVSISIFSLSGEIVYSRTIHSCKAGDHREYLPAHLLRNDCFIIRIVCGNTSISRRIPLIIR